MTENLERGGPFSFAIFRGKDTDYLDWVCKTGQAASVWRGRLAYDDINQHGRF